MRLSVPSYTATSEVSLLLLLLLRNAGSHCGA